VLWGDLVGCSARSSCCGCGNSPAVGPLRARPRPPGRPATDVGGNKQLRRRHRGRWRNLREARTRRPL